MLKLIVLFNLYDWYKYKIKISIKWDVPSIKTLYNHFYHKTYYSVFTQPKKNWRYIGKNLILIVLVNIICLHLSWPTNWKVVRRRIVHTIIMSYYSTRINYTSFITYLWFINTINQTYLISIARIFNSCNHILYVRDSSKRL